MKLIYLTLLSFLLMACQPQQVNSTAQQQGFICKSLIEGFLKTQNLGQYQLYSIHPTLHESSAQRSYEYQSSSDMNMRFQTPIQPNLKFSCEQTAQHFTLKLVSENLKHDLHLMSLDIPEEKTIEQMTAFALKTQ